MCSKCNNICGGRGAIAYQNVNNGCGCGNADNGYVNNGCEYADNGCSCGNNIVGSLAKGFACTANRIVRGLDRSLNSCGC